MWHVSNKLRERQSTNARKMMQNDTFCDVKFIVGKQKKQFKANRMFLANISAVFKAMLYGEMQESLDNAEIEIIDTTPDAFKSLLNYAYFMNPNLTDNNIISVRQLCDKYQITDLLECCDEQFDSCILTSTVCRLFNEAVTKNIPKYVEKCQKAIQSRLGNKADEIIQSDGFLSMTLKAMQLFLQSDHLRIKETDLWDRVLKWADHQSVKINANNSDFYGNLPPSKKRKLDEDQDIIKASNKISLLTAIAPYIRFGLMDGKYFVTKVRNEGFLTDKEVADISCYIHSSEQYCGEFNTSLRATWSLKYTLQMSSSSGRNDNYETLVDGKEDTFVSTRLLSTYNPYPWIQARFPCSKRISRIEIAISLYSGHERYLKIQCLNENKWVDLVRPHFANTNVMKINVAKLNINTSALRICNDERHISGSTAIAVNMWKIYGV